MTQWLTKHRVFMLTVAAWMMIAGCGAYGGSDNYGSKGPTGPGSGTGDQPVANPSYKDNILPIFTDNCAFSGCHAGSKPQAGMSLESGKAYDSIVSVASSEDPSLMRIKPGDPDNSYLYLKILGKRGARMPFGKASLSTVQIETIKNWITQGAQDN